MSETIALEKKKQSRFSKRIRNVKQQIASGDIVIKENLPKKRKRLQHKRGVVYIGHIPHGFYETQMRTYFKQFGKVTNLVLCRSHKTGRSKGFAFVEFQDDEVAKIVAETMNNYLMFKKRLIAKYVPFERRPTRLFKGKPMTLKNYLTRSRRNISNRNRNNNLSEDTYTKTAKKNLSKLNKKLEELQKLGINYDFQATDVPKEIFNKNSNENDNLVSNIKDSSESDFEINLSLPEESIKKKSSKSLSKVKKDSKSGGITKKVKTTKSSVKQNANKLILAAKNLLGSNFPLVTKTNKDNSAAIVKTKKAKNRTNTDADLIVKTKIVTRSSLKKKK